MSTGKEPKPSGQISVGKRLRELRLERGLKQREIAEIMGVSEGHYGNVESGATGIGQSALLNVARECGVSISWLLSGDGPRDISRAARILAGRSEAGTFRYQSIGGVRTLRLYVQD